MDASTEYDPGPSLRGLAKASSHHCRSDFLLPSRDFFWLSGASLLLLHTVEDDVGEVVRLHEPDRVND